MGDVAGFGMTIAETLAFDVMGWKPGGMIFSDGWAPEKNLSDAFLVAEKIGGLTLTQISKTEWVARFHLDRVGRTPAEAISRAAMEWLKAKR